MVFINDSGQAYAIINGLNGLTGSFFLTLLMLILIIIAICLSLRMELEWTAIFILPLLLVCWAYVGDFVTVGGITLIYLAIILAKNFFLR